jgi:simple sugar transport system ATP-binding protein
MLRVARATKRYGALVAVSEATLDLEACKIHAIVGENGAGKSTLSAMAAGLVVPDEGHVEIGGARLRPHTARAAIARGVGFVQQHFRLIDALTVIENAMLGVEPSRAGFVDVREARAKLEKVQREIGSSLDANARVASLGVGDRQRLEIARVLFRDARVLILDEPTAVLSPQESNALYATLRRLADGGRAVAVVTHKMDEVLDHADDVTVMRRGRVVSTRAISREGDREAQKVALVHDAFHDESATQDAVARREPARALIEIEALRDGVKLDGVSLSVRSREIVGIAGVEGNGQTELALALAGLVEFSGVVRAHAEVEVVHDDRHRRGLVVEASVGDNAVLGELGRFVRRGLVRLDAMRAEASKRVRDGEVVPREIDLPVDALSGGNQQKLVVARALARGGNAERVLVFAQPTRGVDLAAARQIHARIASAADTGAAVIVLSADLDELRALADRIVVMTRGHIVFETRRDANGAFGSDATNESLGARMIDRQAAS